MHWGKVPADAADRISVMAFYPPVAHWMAALIGWVSGSGLIGMSMVSIAAAFLSYLLALRITADTPIKLVLFLGAFLVLSKSLSLVGWEIVSNFFYPQLVGDAFYFFVLWSLTKTNRLAYRSAIFIVAGGVTMWLQPLSAIQIIGAGCILLALEGIRLWRDQRAFPSRYAVSALVAVIVAGVVFFVHPELKIMRQISTNNGALEFRYKHIMLVAAFCGAICTANAVRYVFRDGNMTDLVISAAGIAAYFLALTQFMAWTFLEDGSPYAIKKHMFIVVTVGMMNCVRLVGDVVDRSKGRGQMLAECATPLVAAYMASRVLCGFTEPLAPTIRALDYARQIATYQFPQITSDNTVASDVSLPLLSNALISRIAFNHPLNTEWWYGMKITDGVKYAMIRRTSSSDVACTKPHAITDKYAVVDTSCLISYMPNSSLNFSSTGNGRIYQGRGWSTPEPWGTWSLANLGGEIHLTLPNLAHEPLLLEVDGMAYITPRHDQQTIIVEINGTEVAKWNFNKQSPGGLRTASFSSDILKGDAMNIVFKAPGAVSPAQDGGPNDQRVLGFGLKALVVRSAS